MCNEHTTQATDDSAENPWLIGDPTGPVSATQAQSEPFAAIREPFTDLQIAVITGDREGAQAAAQRGLDVAFEPYYQGRGEFDHARLFADLQRSKGSELGDDESQTIGRAVGRWTARRYFWELEQSGLSLTERAERIADYATQSWEKLAAVLVA